MEQEIIIGGKIKEILEVREKYKTTYSIHFMRFVLQTKDEEFVVKISSYIPKIRINDKVVVEGRLFDRDSYNNDDRRLVRAIKVEKINPQMLLNKFVERG